MASRNRLTAEISRRRMRVYIRRMVQDLTDEQPIPRGQSHIILPRIFGRVNVVREQEKE